MPNLTVVNLTSRVLPISTYFGTLEHNATRTKELSVEYLEAIGPKLAQLEAAGLISYTVAPETNEEKFTFATISSKSGLWQSGTGCPNGSAYGTAGAVYTNKSGGAAAAAGAGAYTTIAAALINPNPSPAVDYITLNDGVNSYVFQFTDATHALVMVGARAVLVTGLSADQVRDAIIAAVNATDIRMTLSSGGAATVTVTQDDLGAMTGAAITDNVSNAGFVTTPLAGATNSTLWVHAGISTIASSTNANPIEITTAAAHGLASGNVVTIRGHVTNTSANGTWKVTYVSPTKFTLNTSIGVGVGGATGTLTLEGNLGTRYNWIGK